MLAKEQRISKVLRRWRGISTTTSLFSLRSSANDLSRSRFAFVVSKRVERRATVRNRVKRQMSACIEDLLKSVRPGFDVIFYVKKEVVSHSQQSICESIKDALQKQKILI